MAVIKAFLEVRQKEAMNYPMFDFKKIYEYEKAVRLCIFTSLLIYCSRPRECHVINFNLLD